MSTKVYNGVKFKSRDWKEVLDQLLLVKKSAKEIGNRSIKKSELELFIKANNLVDKDSFDIFFTLQEALESGNQRHQWAFLPRVKYTIFLYPTKEGDIYGYYFNDIHEYEKLLTPYIDEYCYYDNTDHPEHISYEDWNKRGDKWDELVPDRFSDTGFKYSIVSGDDIDRGIIQPQIDEIKKYLKRDIKIENVLDGDK